MTTADVSKHKALKVDPQEYISCCELRKKVCPVFAEVQIDKELQCLFMGASLEVLICIFEGVLRESYGIERGIVQYEKLQAETV